MDHMKQFKQSRDNVTALVGKIILDGFTKNNKECEDETDAIKKNEIEDSAFNKWMSHSHMR